MTCNVAFIGLGVMGYPMAGYISKGGYNVTVFNRTKSKAEKWIKDYKGKIAETPAEAAKDAEFIFTCVGNDNDLREVTFGDNGAFKTIKEGSVYIDNTTASATIAREIYDYAKKNNFGALDAPVSGGQAGAENGALTVMIGGDQSDFEKAEDKIDCYSKKMKLLGKAGSGQLAKFTNQILICGILYSISEAFIFSKHHKINQNKLFELRSKKPIYPSHQEININRPSRSAKLRAIKKIGTYENNMNVFLKYENLLNIENFSKKL